MNKSTMTRVLERGHLWGRGGGVCRKCGQSWAATVDKWLDWCPCWKLRLPKLKAPISNQRESQEAPHPQDK